MTESTQREKVFTDEDGFLVNRNDWTEGLPRPRQTGTGST